MRRQALFAMFVIAALMLSACKREERELRPSPPASEVVNETQVSGINPGGHPLPGPPVPNMYEESAYSTSEGKRLFSQYNCSGCHANGGGGIGPPLMDNYWVYGGEPQNIFTTIIEGRPNGMPSFRGRIPEHQAWQLVAYVRSMSGLVSSGVAPNRSDGIAAAPAESQRKALRPEEKKPR